MEKLVLLGIVVLAAVWYFKNKKSKSKNVKDNIQEEFTETCCSKPSEVKEEVKEEIKEEPVEEVCPASDNKEKITNINNYKITYNLREQK